MKSRGVIRCILKHTPLWKLYQKYQVVQWQRQDPDGPPPHIVKETLLKEYADRFHLVRFVETGTLTGAMVSAMRRVMKEIWSIELDHDLYENAERKFHRFENIHILEGDSAQVLGKLLGSTQEPCLFWLDAHYSGGITACGEQETPVISELKHIIRRNVLGDVILIDDARCFTGHNDYPSIAELESFVRANRPEWELVIASDVIRLTPAPKHSST